MATNLRLAPEAEEAVRREALRTGRSQQDIIREAVGRYLGLSRDERSGPDEDGAAKSAAFAAIAFVTQPRSAYRQAAERITLPAGRSSDAALDRGDRI